MTSRDVLMLLCGGAVGAWVGAAITILAIALVKGLGDDPTPTADVLPFRESTTTIPLADD